MGWRLRGFLEGRISADPIEWLRVRVGDKPACCHLLSAQRNRVGRGYWMCSSSEMEEGC